jgi:hypothetical protein
MPWQWAPQSVFKPNDLYNGGGGMNGLGAPYEDNKEALQYNTGEGVFRPGGHGGGIFDNSIAGIFSGVQKAIGALGLGATTGPVPSSCWSDQKFVDCQKRVFAQAQLDCPKTGYPNAVYGSYDDCVADLAAEYVGPSSQPTTCVSQYCAAGGATTGSSTYPWGVYSADTKALQEATNTALKAAGYCPLTVDGKLGPATCGARQTLGLSVPSTCTSFKAPSKGPCTSIYVASAATSTNITPEQQAAITASMTGGSSDWKRYAAFGVGALAVVGAAWYFNKKKKGRG